MDEPTGISFINLTHRLEDFNPLQDPRRDAIGGKAQGLLFIHHLLAGIERDEFLGIHVEIPHMTVIETSVFDAFMQRNHLEEIAFSNLSDERIAYAFQRADMPFEILGRLNDVVQKRWTPLAIRSSGLLEDMTRNPFAGVYVTKMIPNNQKDPNIRFQKLIEAIKFVWASTYFRIAKDYCKATGLDIKTEKMAVIIQDMVGKSYQNRFYPELSGVARSFNYYPVKPARPADGVVDLALGLGKTIVDGGKSWTYSPAYPQMPPPFGSVETMLEETQNEFWVVNTGELPAYNPIKETEFMHQENLVAAERDHSLNYLASTFDLQSERLSMGVGSQGPRVLTFSPLLCLNEIPFNPLIKTILKKCETALNSAVEIEFAMTFNPARFGFLQVRPMVAPSGDYQLSERDLMDNHVVLASETVVGNGSVENINNIVYVKPETFNLKYTQQIAEELERFNHKLLEEKSPYLLIVFGRLGTLDPWLGIPISWGQICGARVIVEATQENVKVELSQGSHYFHNIVNLGVLYFTMPFSSPYRINWDWIYRQPVAEEGEFVCQVKLPFSLNVKVDGQHGRGVILQA
jgi:hypothetical protein